MAGVGAVSTKLGARPQPSGVPEVQLERLGDTPKDEDPLKTLSDRFTQIVSDVQRGLMPPGMRDPPIAEEEAPAPSGEAPGMSSERKRAICRALWQKACHIAIQQEYEKLLQETKAKADRQIELKREELKNKKRPSALRRVATAVVSGIASIGDVLTDAADMFDDASKTHEQKMREKVVLAVDASLRKDMQEARKEAVLEAARRMAVEAAQKRMMSRAAGAFIEAGAAHAIKRENEQLLA